MIVYISDHALARNIRRHSTVDEGNALANARQHASSLTKRGLWECACAWDGVHVDEMFVVFSDGNPYAAFYDRAVYINPSDITNEARNAINDARKARREQRA